MATEASMREWFAQRRTWHEVKLRQARLVLELVTTFGGFTIPVFIQATQAHSAWPSLRGYVQWLA